MRNELTLAQIRILFAIDKGSTTLYSIHRDKQMSIATVSGSLLRMKKNGLIYRTKKTKTRRISWEYSLTPYGSTQLSRIRILLKELLK